MKKINNKYLQYIILLNILVLFGCSDDGGIHEDIAPELPETPKPIGEVFLEIPESAYYINKMSDGYFVSGRGFLDLNNDSRMEMYPLIATLNDSFKVQQLKFPLTKSSSDRIAIGAVEYDGSYYTFLCNIIDGINPKMNASIVKTDLEGNILWEKFLPQTLSIHSFTISKDNELIILGSNGYFMSDSYVPTYVLNVNLNGEIVYRRDFTIEENIHIGENIISEPGNFTFLAYQLFDMTIKPRFVKINESGSILINKIFDGYRRSYFYVNSTHLIQKNDGGFIFSHTPGSYIGNIYQATKYLKILTSSGEEIMKSDIEKACGYEIDIIENIIQTSDGFIYLLGSHNVQWGFGPWQICVLKFDNNGNYLASRKYDELGDKLGERIIETAEGDLLILTSGESLFKIDSDLSIL